MPVPDPPLDAILHAWTFEPLVVVPLVVTCAVYAIGVRRLWRAAERGRGLSAREVAAFAAGCAAIVIALVSPLDAMSETLLSAHMVQHELLMIVAAPLIVMGAPMLACLWAMPMTQRKAIAERVRRSRLPAIWTAITAPALVWLLHACALWIWHLPRLYQLALEHDDVHALEHVCFFGTAALFWWGLTRGRYGRLGYGSAVIYVFTTALHSGLLALLLTMSPRALYPFYQGTTAAWGVTPLEDQQLAGLIMWVPAGVIFAGMGLCFFAAWLRESERRANLLASSRRAGIVLAAIACALPLWACGRTPAGRAVSPAPLSARTAVGPIPGGGSHAVGPGNPYAGDLGAALEGRRIFVQFNCVGCHGGRAGGGMGPSLRDVEWLYGSADAQIFNSIAEGRDQGMPAWGVRVNDDQIWKLVAYIKTLRTRNEPDAPR
jgi:putative membrane protein